MKHQEDILQQSVFKWFSLQYPEKRGLLFHVPNGGKRSAIEAGKFKSMGVVPGVCDLLLIHAGRLYGIELKTEKGKLSPHQINIHKIWRRSGVVVYVCYGLDQAKSFIEKIVGGYFDYTSELFQQNALSV